MAIWVHEAWSRHFTINGTRAASPAGGGEGSKVPVGTLVLTPRPEFDVSNPGPDHLDQTFIIRNMTLVQASRPLFASSERRSVLLDQVFFLRDSGQWVLNCSYAGLDIPDRTCSRINIGRAC